MHKDTSNLISKDSLFVRYFNCVQHTHTKKIILSGAKISYSLFVIFPLSLFRNHMGTYLLLSKNSFPSNPHFKYWFTSIIIGTELLHVPNFIVLLRIVRLIFIYKEVLTIWYCSKMTKFDKDLFYDAFAWMLNNIWYIIAKTLLYIIFDDIIWFGCWVRRAFFIDYASLVLMT